MPRFMLILFCVINLFFDIELKSEKKIDEIRCGRYCAMYNLVFAVLMTEYYVTLYKFVLESRRRVLLPPPNGEIINSYSIKVFIL